MNYPPRPPLLVPRPAMRLMVVARMTALNK